MPCGCRFKGGKHGTALADELVQLERERASAVVAEQLAAARQQLAQALPAYVEGCASGLGQTAGRIGEGPGHPAAQPTPFFWLYPKLALGPAGEGVGAEGGERENVRG